MFTELHETRTTWSDPGSADERSERISWYDPTSLDSVAATFVHSDGMTISNQGP